MPMCIAILSDIHGNWEALRSVLEDAEEQGAEAWYHLGDVVGYGEGGGRCLRCLRDRGIPSVQGNHDGNIRPPRDRRMRGEALEVLEREFNELADEEVSYLQQLPHPLPVDDRMVLAHGSLTGRDDYILNAAAVKACRELLLETYAGMRFCFFGHTHLPMVICGTSVDTEFRESRTVELDPFANYLVNPGSVGQPRDQCPQASYALFEPEESCLTIRRVEYNIEAEQARMAGAGLPEKLIRRIAVGV